MTTALRGTIGVSDSKLIERVMKLFALAAGTNFAAEAATARAMAETLIAKHNITLPSTKDRAAFTWVKYAPHFKGAQWELILAEAVCKACGSQLFFSKKLFETRDPNDYFALAGTVADLEACQYLLAMLNEQRMRDWMKAKSEGVADSFYSFCFSFARGVERNIEARLTAHELARSKQAWLWYDQNVQRIKQVDVGIYGGQGRSEAGRAAGQAAALHRGNLGVNLKRLPKS